MALPGFQTDNYGFRRNDAMSAFNQAKLQVGRKRQSILQEYGYVADYDAQGNMTGMRLDPTAKYGKFQTMMKTHAGNLDAAEQSKLDRGLGTGGGLGAQAETDARFNMGADQDQLQRALSGGMADLGDAETAASAQYNRDIAGIDYEEAGAKWQQQQWEQAQAAQQEQAAAAAKRQQELMDVIMGKKKPKKVAAMPSAAARNLLR